VSIDLFFDGNFKQFSENSVSSSTRIRRWPVLSRISRISFGNLGQRVPQQAMTGIVTVDFLPVLAHGETRDLDRRFEDFQRVRARQLCGYALRCRRDARGAANMRR